MFEVLHYARACEPVEAVGALFGFRRQWQQQAYTVVEHWEPGSGRHTSSLAGRLDAFELQGIRQNLDRRGGTEQLGALIGICHSHPFGHASGLSDIDRDTFLSFPYNHPGNAFLLVEPSIGMVRWYLVQQRQGVRELIETEWVGIAEP